MIIVDAHCDTISKIFDEKADLYKNSCHIDVERLNNYGGYVQFFAAFIDPIYRPVAMKRTVQLIEKLYEQVKIYSNSIMLCCNYNDVNSALNQKKAAAILSIEGGDALQGELAVLRTYYRLGVRGLTLTWNHRNELADGVADGSSGGGLTPFGCQVVKEMNSLGMLVDISHISERGFWDVIDITDSPIIASHSNARKVCGHKRNLFDEQIFAIKKNGGVIGINFFPAFLNDSGKASIKDIIKHIEYIAALTGSDHIGIGADFDGIEDTPEGVCGVQDLDKIFNELLKLNYPEESVQKLAGKNFMRVIESVLK